MGEQNTLVQLMDYQGQIGSVMLWTIVAAFVCLYLVEETRVRKGQPRDSLLGPKSVLCMLMTLGAQFLVIGLTVMIAAKMETNMAIHFRTGLALTLGSAINLILPALLYYKLIRPRAEPDVLRRAFSVNIAFFGVFSSLWVTSSAMNLLHGIPTTTPVILAAVYTLLLVGATATLMFPLSREVDRQQEQLVKPDYTSFNDHTGLD